MKEHRDLIMPATSLDSQEMELDPLTLSFPGDIEGTFLDDFFKNSLRQVRLSLFAGILFYGFFGILDATLVPEMKGALWLIRFAVVCPCLLGVILFSFLPHFKRYFQISVAAAMMIAGFGIIAMISIIPPPVNYSYYAGLILVFIWGYSFTRVRFTWATLAGWTIVVFYEIVSVWVIDTPASIQIGNSFFVISANIIGMFVCYSIEYYTRRDFFLAYLLENEQGKLKTANIRLEKIVQERTSQLRKSNKELRLEIEERKRAEKDRAELESRFQQAQKMESMGTLAGGIAHDFNNLLMGIQGNTSLVFLDMDSHHSHYDKLKNIEQYVMKGSELTKQLLGFASGGKYEVKPTDLNEIIKKNSQMFWRTKKEITISAKYQEGTWTVNVDQGQIEQVLMNLFVNAWQAMPGGGNLYIETENITLDTDYAIQSGLKPGNYVKLSVTDTGTGMDEATMQKIFDPFFTTKEMGRGTGLGLASVYGIIKNHDGFIDVHSEKGNGSTFSVYLPTCNEQVIKEEELFQETFKGTETVLLVDDEEMVVGVTSEMLKSLGYQTLTARSGKEAIEVYKANRDKIDIVIIDMIMPGLGGGEVYNILKGINHGVKALLSSGYSINGQAEKILEGGCDGFIQKPFDITQISRKIREILDKG